jgi:hypothetical protein
MGLLGCPVNFQRLMEAVLSDIENIIVSIDNLLVYTDMHNKNLQVSEKVLARLQKKSLEDIPGDMHPFQKEVSNLGFTLTQEGIKHGKNKLEAKMEAKPPMNVKTIRSFMGLCNLFQTPIKDFTLILVLLFKLTRKNSEYKS